MPARPRSPRWKPAPSATSSQAHGLAGRPPRSRTSPSPQSSENSCPRSASTSAPRRTTLRRASSASAPLQGPAASVRAEGGRGVLLLRVAVRGPAEVAVAHDAEVGAHGELGPPVAVLRRHGPARAALVAVLGSGEQPDDLDVVPVPGPLQGPAAGLRAVGGRGSFHQRSTSPYSRA